MIKKNDTNIALMKLAILFGKKFLTELLHTLTHI